MNYCEKAYERSGKNLFWSIKKSGEVLDKLKARFKPRPVCLHMIVLLFTLLNLIIQLKIKSLILSKEPSKEKAHLTLHVTTETQFSLL